MGQLKNELSWSISRDRQFKDCKRSYYYQYYQSWGGWDYKADEVSRKTYLLKNIQSIDIWIGDIVHQVIQWVLESYQQGREISFEEANQKALTMFKQTWSQSINKAWQQNIKRNLNLFEHYYNVDVSNEDIREKMQKAAKCIKNFYQSGVLNGLKAQEIISVDQFDSFICEGVKVFAIPDLVLKKDNYILFDWKTGKPSEKDCMQLSFYIHYAMDKWGIAEDDVQIVPVYLAEDKVAIEDIAPIHLDTMLVYMHESYDSMKAVLSDLDNNVADIALCPKTEDAWRCNNCKFKEICS